ncbi:Cytochrome b561 [Sinobacterium norvegicum]|uniref:Cytochrome b561 n=1 Tax=Sinobacterium norvegicum TaxID=1641715 RepID=A0ABN8EMA6_9GAMM|nr:cytochrome b [Sinobacterium norvegicum]CAH0992379.1 Cytochrome b561 [Sinobacterium norvegicum]
MQWRNNQQRWGMTAIFLHWLVAIAVIGLFGLGWWMTGLSYYDVWYKQGPYIHKSIALILFAVVIGRMVWRKLDPPPAHNTHHARWEINIAKITHGALYLLLLIIFVSGYLISTADGRAISVFDWFEVPATIQGITNQEDIAGAIHWYGACVLMTTVGLHALGALKHQIIDKDGTLSRMFGLVNKR